MASIINENVLYISKNIEQSFLIDKFKSIDQGRCSKILNNFSKRFVVDLYEDKFDTRSKICEEIDKALDNQSFIQLEVENEKFEVYPISYVLRKEGLCLYCYREEYMIILVDKISDAIVCNKGYDGNLISYTENKDKMNI